ncbi:MAG: AmmeMemoRadiSam system protein A [Defluviitaleaceae bacterium]|nr:AmmeMemoRadiSam system protein A [Defluviitaleaceae bacterium]
MPILSAYVMPHPPLAVPEVGRGKEGIIAETVQAMDETAIEISRLKPETIIYITPHGAMYSDYFHISPGESASGDFSRFGVAGAKFFVEYDAELTGEISRLICGTDGETDAALDHGVMVPMYYINRRYANYKAVRVSISGHDAATHFEMGKILAAACQKLGRQVVVVASGDLSHKLSEDGPYGFAPEAAVFDREIMKHLGDGNFNAILSMDEKLRRNAAECGFGSVAILAGVLAGEENDGNKTGGFRPKALSYECPFGVGYGVVAFTPEDPYCALARRALEFRVKTGNDMLLSDNDLLNNQTVVQDNPIRIPPEMLNRRAGAFVSLHKNGQLRGCIGTISPTTDCVAREILQNAVSAGLYDSRFPPMHESELPHITYKVDILDSPEDIAGPEALDVKEYGVIVEAGHKRGLLLPNLDGINTVQQQIDIARQKAGIHPHEGFTLKRFKVTRHDGSALFCR